MTWQIDLQPSDTLIRSCLIQNRVASAYALGDLQPPLRERSSFTYAHNGAEWAIVLIYRTTTFKALIPFGAPAGVAALLEADPQLPRACIISNGTAEVRPALERWFKLGPEEKMYRLVMTSEHFHSFQGEIACEDLGMQDIGEMSAFYTMNDVPTFSPDQVQNGFYCGLRRHGVLVAVGGTHFINYEDRIAAIGNVYTDTILRGNGYARAIISTLIQRLFEKGCREVVLDVAINDFSALQRYEPLGFTTQVHFWEAKARLK
ncbi:MAG: GNAT family N-acetyltransferase [Herpetosiphonaceae bacterium]|nr:GNAT family N-acetyltransferase [Herpetosiphonaceae bacterium]